MEAIQQNLTPQQMYNWVDVRHGFQQSCQDIEKGELVHDSLFGLFEAMSAIEIMDPKMDAGMVCNQTRKIFQLPEAVQNGKVKMDDFSEEEVLGIINELTACFTTWLDGHSLVQTVFTCLFCHNPSVVSDPVLKAFCISTLKMVNVIRNICINAKVFEEEDFQPLTYGFKLSPDVTELRVSGMIREAEDETTKKMKAYQNGNEEGNKEKVELCRAIRSRLKFWRSLYWVLLTFEKQDCTEINKCKELLQSAKELLLEIKTSSHLGLKPDKAEEYYMIGFDPLVNQRLLPPSFPRQSEIIDQDICLEHMGLLIHRLTTVCSVLDCPSFHLILEFLCDFSKKLPCVLSRSVLQLIVYHPGNKIFGRYLLTDLLKDAIKLFNAAPSVADMSPLTSPEAKQIVNQFLMKAARPMVALMEAYGHNRARQREKLGALLEDFGILQAEADQVDQALHFMLQEIDGKRQHLACFESWVLYHALTIMIQHTFLGFELELYSAHEFHYVYWCLDYLFGWTNNCLHRAEMLLALQEQYVEKKCGKKEKKKKKEILAICSDQIKERKSLRFIFNGMKELCMGNIKAYEGFDKDNKIKHPEPFFDNEKIRFERRFQCFQPVDTHQSVHYKDYKELTRTTKTNLLSSKNFFDQAMVHYQRAMDALHVVEEVDVEGEKLMKVAKTNFIVMRLASSGHKRNSSKFPMWDFSFHYTYPLIRLL